jgi:hypothetical protein
MIPLPPLCAVLSRPEQGELPWSEWELRDAHGFRVAGGMDKFAAQTLAIWANEHLPMRLGLVGIAGVCERYGLVERLAMEALGEWKEVEEVGILWTDEVEEPPVQKLIDGKGRLYSVTDNQRKAG